jgi:hypothetical protein
MYKVYVVVDDGEAEAVFSTRESALEAIRKGIVSHGSVQECVMDPEEDAKIEEGLRYWSLHIRKGKFCNSYSHSRKDSYHVKLHLCEHDQVNFEEKQIGKSENPDAWLCVWAKSEEDAKQRALEVYNLALKDVKEEIAEFGDLVENTFNYTREGTERIR